jgi:hypothetical protein
MLIKDAVLSMLLVKAEKVTSSPDGEKLGNIKVISFNALSEKGTTPFEDAISVRCVSINGTPISRGVITLLMDGLSAGNHFPMLIESMSVGKVNVFFG